MTDYVKTYPCPTCSATASGRGHLCHPTGGEQPYECKFCKKTVDDARHVCTGMLDKMEYICKKCGRLAIYDSILCEPSPVDSD
jgi:predicted RNA-binding Zn-ribbon protein involved in translation (DUF1610 family)